MPRKSKLPQRVKPVRAVRPESDCSPSSVTKKQWYNSRLVSAVQADTANSTSSVAELYPLKARLVSFVRLGKDDRRPSFAARNLEKLMSRVRRAERLESARTPASVTLVHP
eukprot:1179191-Prorocentrum_minimum.AAC.9